MAIEKPKNMRVTVSMPVLQIERMDAHAAKLGISRNAFMQIALAEFMTNREIAQEGIVKELLNAINVKVGDGVNDVDSVGKTEV